MSDYNFLMESRLSPEQFQALTQISRTAASQGINLYLVGGAVRDLTYGQQTVRDLDFAVEGNPEKIVLRLHSSHPATRHVGGPGGPGSGPLPAKVESLRFNRRLNSAELRFSNGVRAGIAMTRREVYAKYGRRPEVLPGMIFDDLRRRDFSVNAMAVSLHPNSRGLLLDPTNGAADIEKRELRVLYSRSFLEDPSRVYRLLRLGRRLEFKPEERTKTWLESALESRVWERMDPERRASELRALLQEENPGRALKVLAAWGLLSGLDKKLASMRIPYERFAKIRSVAQAVPGSDPYLLNFHCIVQKLSRGHRNRLARSILAHPKTIKLTLSLDRAARKLERALRSSKSALPSQVYTLLSEQPQDLLLYLLVYDRPAVVQKRVKNFLLKYRPAHAKVAREELTALGVEPGRKFEKILECAFLDQLDGKIKTRQQLMKQLRALAGIKEPPPARPSKRTGHAPRPRKK